MLGAEKMGKRPGRNHSAAFKAKAALEAINGESTVAGFAQLHDVHPNHIRRMAASVAGAYTYRDTLPQTCTAAWPSNTGLHPAIVRSYQAMPVRHRG